MYAVQPDQPIQMTEADYLEFEAASDKKYEYSRGRVYAMTGGSVRHGVITASMITHLGNQLDDRNCSVTSPDVRVYIGGQRAYRYPDVTVFCGQPSYIEGRTDTITNPVLLVEVLSPATALTDRNDKLVEYTQIESLLAYMLISQHEARVESYTRHESGQWLYQYVTGLDADISIPPLGLTLALSKIYQKVNWNEET